MDAKRALKDAEDAGKERDSLREEVAEHKAELERQGFRITENLAGIPTAIMGEAGDEGEGGEHLKGLERRYAVGKRSFSRAPDQDS